MTTKPKPQRRGNRPTVRPGWDEAEILPPAPARGHDHARHVDWKARLIVYLAQSVGKPFVYGEFDCALFTLGAVAEMTGFDLTTEYRGRYSTLVQGVVLARRDGFRDHVELVAAHFAEIAPAFAQAGDIAVVEGADGPALGLVQGEHIYALMPGGLVLVPLLAAIRAFRVT